MLHNKTALIRLIGILARKQPILERKCGVLAHFCPFMERILICRLCDGTEANRTQTSVQG